MMILGTLPGLSSPNCLIKAIKTSNNCIILDQRTAVPLGRHPRFNSVLYNAQGHSLISVASHEATPGRSLLSSRLRAFSGDLESSDDREERRFAHAILLCYMASQNRSLFAAKCFVETMVEMYRRGYTLDDIKLSVMLATLATADPLKPIALDILLAWSSIVMMTLRTVGVPLLPEGEARRARKGRDGSGDAADEEDKDRMTQGLENFAKQCLEKYQDGTDLFRLQLQQSMAGSAGDEDPEAGGESPAVYVMQQNTRLAIITLDAVRALNLPTTVPLKRDQPPPTSEEESEEHDNDDEDEPAVVQQPPNPFAEPSGYLTGILEEAQDLTAKLAGSSGAERAAVLRGAAVSLLIAYNGAALGYLRPARAFIEEAAACYAAGCSVDEIYGALKNEEFAQSGGVMRFGVVALPGERSVSATLFARWLSLVFMTLAQLGVPHPGAGEKVGWAWEASAGTSGQLDGSSAIEAHGLAGFVSSTLRLAVQSDEESGGDDDARMEGGRRGVRPLVGAAAAAGEEDDATEGSPIEGFAGTGFEDPSLLQTSSFALVMSQQISLIRLTRIFVLQQGKDYLRQSVAPPA